MPVRKDERSMGSNLNQLQAIAEASSARDLFARLETLGLLLRIDPAVQPTTYRCAVVSQAAADLAKALSCTTSRDYGRPFAEIFKACKFDFYQIDPQLFAPARVAVTAIDSGHTFHAGHFDEVLLDKSFGSIA